MPRSTNNPASRRRRRKVLKRAKGFVGGRRKLFRTANETVNRALYYATRDRKARKRLARRLWNVRINAACRQFGTTYSRFISGLKKAKINLDRKSLAELAVHDLQAMEKLIHIAVKNSPVPSKKSS